MNRTSNVFAMIALCASLFFIIGACNDPTTVGAGIVDEDVIPVQVAEFDVQLTQRLGDPVLTYSDQLSIINHAQCGRIQDDIFGESTASFYMQFIPASEQLASNENRIVDSVVFVLYLDVDAAYGAVGESSIGIRQLTETIDGDQDYLSDQTFDEGDEILSSFTFTPDYDKIDTPADSRATLRIPLPLEVGTEVMAFDSAVINDSDEFLKAFPGFHIYPTNVSNHYTGFRPYLSTSQTSNSAIRIYYRDTVTDEASEIFSLVAFIGSGTTPVVQHYTYNYEGSAVQSELDNPTGTKLYIQGNGGVNIDMTFDGLPELGNVIVNKAELAIPFDENAIPYELLPQLRTLLMTRRAFTGSQVFAIEFQETGVFAFTPIGRIDTVENDLFYTYNIPITTQQLVDQTIFDDKIRLQSIFVPASENQRNATGPSNLSESSARSVIFGRQNSSEAIRLKVSYTTEN